MFREAGNQSGEVHVLSCLGEALLGDGQADQAGRHYAAGLDLASQIGETYERASAHNGLDKQASLGEVPLSVMIPDYGRGDRA